MLGAHSVVAVLRRACIVAAAISLAACAGAAPGTTYAPAASGYARAAARPAYSVANFFYRVMPLRTRPAPAAPGGIIYPADLTDYGGPVMKSAVWHNIYVNCPAENQSCWGAPETFQKKLAGSAFAAMLRQYTGSAPTAYTFGEGTAVTYPVFGGRPLYENDVLEIVHEVAASLKKTGYANEYHVFLPQGTSTCFDFSASCYSPGRAADFGFCAYHASARFSDIGTVIYSVEPYQDIAGCSTKASSGASAVTNSTISTLAHETFESITDPGPKLAWINYQFGEIGDECEYFVTPVTLGGTLYNTQPMYSNRYHACSVK